jgi:uncharacterized protein (TIGR03066 family)
MSVVEECHGWLVAIASGHTPMPRGGRAEVLVHPTPGEDEMNALKLLAVGAIVCVMSAGARAEEKIDYAKMLVGKWEVTKADPETVPPGTIVEFTKDGKFKVGGKKDDVEMNLEGTYTVEKNTFTFTLKIGDEEKKDTITITKITDKEMYTKNKEDKKVELTRKK